MTKLLTAVTVACGLLFCLPLSGCAFEGDVEGDPAGDVASPIGATFDWASINPYEADSCKSGGPDDEALLKRVGDKDHVEAGEYRVFLREKACSDDSGCQATWQIRDQVQVVRTQGDGSIVSRKFLRRGRLFWDKEVVPSGFFSHHEEVSWNFEGGPVFSTKNLEHPDRNFGIDSYEGGVEFSTSRTLFPVGVDYDRMDQHTFLAGPGAGYVGYPRSIGKWPATVGQGCVRIATTQELRTWKATAFGPRTADRNYWLVEFVLYGRFNVKR